MSDLGVDDTIQRPTGSATRGMSADDACRDSTYCYNRAHGRNAGRYLGREISSS